MAKTHAELETKPIDYLKRLWFKSSVKLENIDQCPNCRGTDQAYEVYEGWGITLFKYQM